MLSLLIFWFIYHYDTFEFTPLNVIDIGILPTGLYFLENIIERPWDLDIYEHVGFSLWLGRMLLYHWYFLNKYPKYYAGYLLCRVMSE